MGHRKAQNTTAQTVEADCWKCGGFLEDGCGSYLLVPCAGDYLFTCVHCGAVNELPKWARIEDRIEGG